MKRCRSCGQWITYRNTKTSAKGKSMDCGVCYLKVKKKERGESNGA